MNLLTQSYISQSSRWPASGKHILAQFDAETVIVYQAYRPAIGRYAAENQRFGGDFSFNRMSWIKPNFLWMMYRSGWGTKEGQEIVLAVRLKKFGFDTILEQAVHSSFVPEVYGTPEKWKARMNDSDVRLQWDPDHDPNGGRLERRAIQLGLAGEVLRQYAQSWIVEIQDISDFVADQRVNIEARRFEKLLTPYEEVYPVSSAETQRRIELGQESTK